MCERSQNSYFLEKSTRVLWVRTPSGMVLNNLETRRFLELVEDESLVWTFLDGAHDIFDIVLKLEAMRPFGASRCELTEIVGKTISLLRSGGFLQTSVRTSNGQQKTTVQ